MNRRFNRHETLAKLLTYMSFLRNRIWQSRVFLVHPRNILTNITKKVCGSEANILKSGSQTVTALFEMRPFRRVGASIENCSTPEHSIAWPKMDSSFRQRTYAAMMVEIGVRLVQMSDTNFSKLYITLTILRTPRLSSLEE